MDGRRGGVRLAVPEQVDCSLVDRLAAADGVTVEETAALTGDSVDGGYDCAVVPVDNSDTDRVESTLPTLYVAEPAALAGLLGPRADAVTPGTTVEEAVARVRALVELGGGTETRAVGRMSDGLVAVNEEWRVTWANDAGKAVLRASRAPSPCGRRWTRPPSISRSLTRATACRNASRRLSQGD
jgi:hypothetical protein